METQILDIANRIKGLREMLEIEPQKMADIIEVPLNEYLYCESGNKDFNFTFLYKCAAALNVDISELLTGDSPKLSGYSITRANKGIDIKRRKGFIYQYLGHRFKNKLADIFLVTAPYFEDEQDKPIKLSRHEYQEFDYILSGNLVVKIDNKTEILNKGDSIYYDSRRKHGMIATGGEDCMFLAVVIHNSFGFEEA